LVEKVADHKPDTEWTEKARELVKAVRKAKSAHLVGQYGHTAALYAAALAHGVQRDVYLFNLTQDLEGGIGGASFGEPCACRSKSSAHTGMLAGHCHRAQRYPEWRAVDASSLVKQKVVEWDALMS
jgi:hypothetical protein